MAFKAIASNRAKTNAVKADENEFEGLWINVGVVTVEGDDPDAEMRFNRLPRGIAVSDLTEHKIYASTNPEWAAEANLVNALIDKIREKGSQLEEGEAIPLNFSVQLYRRQEQVAQVAGSKDVGINIEDLFG